MKKFLYFFLLFALLSCTLILPLAAGSEGDTARKQSILFRGTVTYAEDIDRDGILDGDGEIRIKIFVESPVGFITLSFSESEFSDMAGVKAEGGHVSIAVDAYTVGAVLMLEYYGYRDVTEKDYFTEADLLKIKNGFLTAARKSESGSVLLLGGEVYDTYKSEEKKNISVVYNEKSGSAVLYYGGMEYNVVKKLGAEVINPIVITENGNNFPISELESKIKSAADGEMLALFSDTNGDGIFDTMDIKSYSEFAPLSAEWNAPAGIAGEAFSYVLFDREARISSPDERTFSSKYSKGTGLSVLIANEKGEICFSSPALCYDSESEKYVRFNAVRSSKITFAEAEGEYIRVTFEGGESVLLPSPEILSGDISAEIFFEASGTVGSKTVNVNCGENSWFYSLARFYEAHGASALAGKTATAVFGADGKAVYAEIAE